MGSRLAWLSMLRTEMATTSGRKSATASLSRAWGSSRNMKSSTSTECFGARAATTDASPTGRGGTTRRRRLGERKRMRKVAPF